LAFLGWAGVCRRLVTDGLCAGYFGVAETGPTDLLFYAPSERSNLLYDFLVFANG